MAIQHPEDSGNVYPIPAHLNKEEQKEKKPTDP